MASCQRRPRKNIAVDSSASQFCSIVKILAETSNSAVALFKTTVGKLLEFLRGAARAVQSFAFAGATHVPSEGIAVCRAEVAYVMVESCYFYWGFGRWGAEGPGGKNAVAFNCGWDDYAAFVEWGDKPGVRYACLFRISAFYK